MQSITQKIESKYMKPQVVNVASGDTVRVSQKIKEGSKERTQIFEGLVIATKRKQSLTNSITVRRIASGVGVEKTFLLHSPLIEKVEIVKRAKVRRNKLNYMRQRSGKSARLDKVDFDSQAVNAIPEPKVEEEKVAEAPETTEEVKEEAVVEEAPVEKVAETKTEDAAESTEEKKDTA